MLKFDSYPELAIPSVPGGSAYSIESQWSGVLIKSGHITGTDEKYETSWKVSALSWSRSRAEADLSHGTCVHPRACRPRLSTQVKARQGQQLMLLNKTFTFTCIE